VSVTFCAADTHHTLVELHKELAKKAKGHDIRALLTLPATGINQIEDMTQDKNTVFDMYKALRKGVDGCDVELEDLAAALERGPVETKFVEELIPRAPHDAWPALTVGQFWASIDRLRQIHEPHDSEKAGETS
jgi:hypothetical protein